MANGMSDGVSSQIMFTVSGLLAYCAFINPTQVNAYFNGNAAETEATDTITWSDTTCLSS